MSKTFRLKPEVLNYLEARQAEWHQESLTDTLHKLVLEHKRLSEKTEKPAEVESLGSKSVDQLSSPSDAPPRPQQAQPPSAIPVVAVAAKRNYLKDGFGSATLVYEKEKARQKARTEAMLERAKQKADFKKQADADKAEREYYLWQRKQKEKPQRGSSRIEGTQDHSYFTDGDWGAEA